MRLPRKRTPRSADAQAAVSRAVTAGEEARERLASASDTRSAAAEQAAHEERTVIAEIRAMRERNHLAEMILSSVERRRP